jgi:transcriptional regulator with XRE-family HTH domain
MCVVEIRELGARLRARRTAAGETIASVAMRAGLSVPYIANLENGRGNPTLTALSALARALGTELEVGLADSSGRLMTESPAQPASLTRFARTPRFAAEAEHLAERAGRTPSAQRELLLAAMSAAAASAAGPGDPGELDWHRILDAIVLISGTERAGGR